MATKQQKQEDLLKIIRNLDISPTMYQNAVEKYSALGNFLLDHGIESTIYPQGSFSLGTIVKPLSDSKNKDYDLDAICEISFDKNRTSPKEIMKLVVDTFNSNETYKTRLTVEDTCCTITYAEVNNVSFSIDIVPAVKEDDSTKNSLRKTCKYPQLIDSAIAINSINDKDNGWATSNPKGLQRWFNEINLPFKKHSLYREKSRIFTENVRNFSSIEDVPDEITRSSLQRVIQLLKRHRDTFYSNIKGNTIVKPNSGILTILITSTAKEIFSNIDTFDLLRVVLEELSMYSELENAPLNFHAQHPNKKLIKKRADEWILENPANPSDNLVDAWNISNASATTFFKWISAAINDFSEMLGENDQKFLEVAGNSFGIDIVNFSLDKKAYPVAAIPATLSKNSQQKPWGIN